jgi:hypothetical protein
VSYEVTASLPRDPDEVWTESAVVGLVGQRPTVNGRPGEILAAWQEGGQVVVRLRVDAEPLSWQQWLNTGFAEPEENR